MIALRLALLPAALLFASAAADRQTASSFSGFLERLWPDAAQEGISRATFDTAFAGLHAGSRRDRRHAAGAGIRQAVRRLILPALLRHRASRSACANRRNGPRRLRAVEEKFGVDRSILVSIWGVESSFGGGEQRWDVFRSIATLAQAALSTSAVPRRAPGGTEDPAGRPHRAPRIRRLLGRRHGTAAVPAVELL